MNWPIFYKTNLRGWFDIDKELPPQFIIVKIIDSDWEGWTEYTFYAYRVGNKYFKIPQDGEITGFSHWKPVTQKEVNQYLKWLNR
jgi:hypothetical protein